jgi:acetyl esterase/lipase
MMRVRLLTVCLLCSFLNITAQKEIKLTCDVSYNDVSPSCVLDIAEPVDVGSDALRPAVVFIHGGAWSAGSKDDMVFRNLMIDYAKQGYVTLSVEYRFHQETEFPACIEDVKCAVRWLKAHAKEYKVDPERIGCTGHSAGGHLAMMLANAQKKEPPTGNCL